MVAIEVTENVVVVAETDETAAWAVKFAESLADYRAAQADIAHAKLMGPLLPSRGFFDAFDREYMAEVRLDNLYWEMHERHRD